MATKNRLLHLHSKLHQQGEKSAFATTWFPLPIRCTEYFSGHAKVKLVL